MIIQLVPVTQKNKVAVEIVTHLAKCIRIYLLPIYYTCVVLLLALAALYKYADMSLFGYFGFFPLVHCSSDLTYTRTQIS